VKIIPLEENEYLKDDGVILVDKYARLKEEMSRMAKELEKVKEAIITYARKEKLEVMVGRNNKLRIRIDEKLKFPDKTQQAERQELEEFIRETGKWLEVSRLDTSALGKVLSQQSWSPDLLEKIKQYARMEKSYAVYLSKLNRNGQLDLFQEEEEKEE